MPRKWKSRAKKSYAGKSRANWRWCRKKRAGVENRAKKVMREKLKSTVKETDAVKKKLDEPLGGTNWAQYDVAVSSQACLRQLKDTFRGVSRAV